MAERWVVEGPDAVPGVRELRAQGFEPIEEHTGALWVADEWPADSKRSVPETRQLWLDEIQTHGRVWMIRSPWPRLSVDDVFRVLWTWIERDDGPMSRAETRAEARAGVTQVLAWDEQRAVDWHSGLNRG